jgi:hypothetical protein
MWRNGRKEEEAEGEHWANNIADDEEEDEAEGAGENPFQLLRGMGQSDDLNKLAKKEGEKPKANKGEKLSIYLMHQSCQLSLIIYGRNISKQKGLLKKRS